MSQRTCVNSQSFRKNSSPRRNPLWHAVRLITIAALVVASGGCMVRSDTALPELPPAPIRSFRISTTQADLAAATPPDDQAFQGQSYSATIQTLGGATPLTSCQVTAAMSSAGRTLSGLMAMVNPANNAQCLVTGVITVTPAIPSGSMDTFTITVTASDSSAPALSDSETYNITVFAGFSINAFMLNSMVAGRPIIRQTVGTNLSPAPMQVGQPPLGPCSQAGATAGFPANFAIDPASTPTSAAGTHNFFIGNGTPPAPGTIGPNAGTGSAGGTAFTMNITCSDGAANTAMSAVMFSVFSELTITTAAGPLAGGAVNAPYNAMLAASGGLPGALTWTATAGFGAAVAGVQPGTGACLGLSFNQMTATVSGSPAAAGTCNFTARVDDTANATTPSSAAFAAVPGQNSVAFSIAIAQAATTTTITSDTPDPSAVGQSIVVTWTVNAVAPSVDNSPTAITGTVTVMDDETVPNSCSAPVAAGTCTIVNPNNTASATPKTLTANYSGDANFTASSDTEAHTVQGANTTTTITSDNADPSVVGEVYTVNVTVAVVAPGMGSPTGTVLVGDGNGNMCTVMTLTAGANQSTGNCMLASTSVGGKTLTASYSGDGNFNPSVGNDTHTVNQASTTTTITSDTPDPSPLATAFTVNVTVAPVGPGAGTPSGAVTVDDGDGNNCVIPDISTTSSCMITSTMAGMKTLTATYIGDANFLGSNGTTAHTVSLGLSVTTITNVTPAATVVGEMYTVTVSVTGPTAATGMVTVDDGDLNTCVIADISVTNSCMITSTLAGNKTLTATYAGDANLQGSNGTTAHTVNQASTTTVITNAAAITATPTVAGDPYAVTWIVTVNAPGAGVPTGTVTVSDGTAMCSAAVAAGTCNLASFAVGVVNVTATYGGDTNFTASASAPPVSHTVLPSATTTVITSDVTDPSVHGQTYTVGVTVTPVPPGSGGPTGSVTISDGTQMCLALLTPGPTNSTGSCQLNTFPVGAYMLTATYPGDGNYGASDNLASPEPHTVNAANTTTTVSTGGATVTGQPYTVTATVVVAAPGTLQTSTITGSITITDGTGGMCTIADVTTSTMCMITSTSAGTKTLTANFTSTSANFNNSVGNFMHTVNQGSTTTTITNAATLMSTPTVTGQSYAVNWSVVINAPAVGTLTGDVTVSDAEGNTCSALFSVGTCNLASRANTPSFLKTITATYDVADADTDFDSSSNMTTHSVGRSVTGMGIPDDSPDPTVVGEPFTVTFAHFITDAGAGTPTGTLTADDGEGNMCTATLPALTCMMPATSVGTKNLTGSYSGDVDFEAIAPSNLASHDVNQASTTITAMAPASVVINTAFSVTWTVTANAPSLSPPPAFTGTVTVTDGVDSCSGPPLVSAGSCMLTLTTSGMRTITVTYSGDTNFIGDADTVMVNNGFTVNNPAAGNYAMTQGRGVIAGSIVFTTTGATANIATCTPTMALPTGLTLTPSGTTCVLGGLPTAGAGTIFNLDFTATDMNGITGMTTTTFSFAIHNPISISPLPAAPVTNARQGSTYNATAPVTQYTSAGGEPPRAMSNPGGSGTSLNTGDPECDGLVFTAAGTGDGRLGGTPTTVGVCTFTLEVTDTATLSTLAGTFTVATYTITVDPGLAIPTATDLKNALRNSAYTSNNITVSNEQGTVSWTVTAGDFTGTTGNGGCAGLSVGAAGATTTVTGTATSAGPSASSSATCGTGNVANSTFTLQASDTGAGLIGPGTATAMFRIRVFGTWLYVADTANDTVEVVDTTSNMHVATITSAQMNSGLNPHSIAITPDGSRAFVTLEASDFVAVINTFDNTVIGTLDVGVNPAGAAVSCTAPRGIAIGTAGSALNRAYVVCSTADAVDVLDVTAAVGQPMRVAQASIVSDGNPEQIAITPAGDFAYASMTGSRDVERIDLATNTGTELNNILPAAGGSFPNDSTDSRGIIVSSDGARVYIGEQMNDDVFVINRGSPDTLSATTFLFPNGNPERMTLSPDGTRVFVTFSGTTDQVVVIVDGAVPAQDTGSPVALTAGDDAIGIAAPPSGGVLYMSFSGADAVGRLNNTSPFASAGANIALPGASTSTPQGMAAMQIPQ